MALRVRSWLSRPSLWRTLVTQARLAVRLLRDPSVPMLFKALPVAALFYVLSPLDFVPDVLPFIGQLDDLTILLIGLELFLKVCPVAAVDFHRTAMSEGRRYGPMPASGQVIDVEFHRER